MKQSEIFALKHYLESFPENVEIEDIFSLLKDDEDYSVIVNEPYIDISDNDYLILKIINMADSIERQFFPLHELITVIDKETVKGIFFNMVGRPASSEELTRLCSLLDTDLSFQLTERITDALKLLNIKNNT